MPPTDEDDDYCRITTLILDDGLLLVANTLNFICGIVGLLKFSVCM